MQDAKQNIRLVDSKQQRESLFDFAAIQRFANDEKIEFDKLRRVVYALFHGHESIDQALSRLSSESRERLQSVFELHALEVVDRHDSREDFSSKFVLRTRDSNLIETVLLRSATGRTSVCVSSQVGCGAGCPFCATSRMGLKRNLTTAEIVEQVRLAARIAKTENRRLRNIVFMGMGEPLDNQSSLFSTIEKLTDPQLFDIPHRRILVSTVGVPDGMRDISNRFPGIHLALSLHSARPELRRRLVPWTKHYSLDELASALRYVAERHRTHRQQGNVMIEYIMISGVNDGHDDLQSLIEFLQGISAHVNLIPYNPIPDGPNWLPTPREQRNAFANQLREAGIFTTIRYSMGSDIQAACGQLVQQQIATNS